MTEGETLVARPLTAFAMSAALFLSACFSSEQPLITAESADTPLPSGVKIADFTNCAGAAGQLMGCQGYRATGSEVLLLDGKTYVIRPDPHSAPPALPAGIVSQDMRVLLKHADGELYIAQLPFDNKAAGSSRYLYEAVRIHDRTAYIYNLLCEQNGDQAYVRSGALREISTALYMPTCEAASLSGLAKIFADRIANGAQPDRKFELSWEPAAMPK
jgi:hypothetical protein